VSEESELADAQAMVGYFADAGSSSIAALSLSQSFLIACLACKAYNIFTFG
jgi:hypothetical protein